MYAAQLQDEVATYFNVIPALTGRVPTGSGHTLVMAGLWKSVAEDHVIIRALPMIAILKAAIYISRAILWSRGSKLMQGLKYS